MLQGGQFMRAVNPLRGAMLLSTSLAAVLMFGATSVRGQGAEDPPARGEATPQKAPARELVEVSPAEGGAGGQIRSVGQEAAGAKEPAQAVDETTVGEPGKTPMAEVDEPRHDFGTVWVNEDLEHTFKIRNAGETTLRIIRVKPACGCTSAGSHPTEIAPGETGEFPFKLSTKRMSSKFTKSISITTNDPKNQQMQLLLTGDVREYVSLEPRVIQFGRVKADTVATQKVRLTNNTNDVLELTMGPTQELGCFSAKIEELQPGKQFELTVTAQPPYQSEINRAIIPLKTNIAKQDLIEVTCIATMPQRIEMRPPTIALAGPSRTQSERKILVTNNDDAPIHVTGVESNDSRLEVSSTEIEAGRKYQISVTIPADYADPAEDAAVIVRTDDAKDSTVRIPVLNRQAPRQEKPQPPAMTLLGKPAPQVEMSTFDGKAVKIGGDNGKVQFLTFYASWCGYCKRSLPTVEELRKKYESNPDVEFVAINLDDRTGKRLRTEAQSIEQYKEWGLNMPMVLDSAKEVGEPYKVGNFPTMFVLGKTGTVEAVHVGAPNGMDTVLSQEIDTLLEGKSLASAAPASVDGQKAVRIPIEFKPATVRSAPAAAGGQESSEGNDATDAESKDDAEASPSK